MKTVYFVRHAESEANVASLKSGQGSDIPLTARGREQARQAGLKLKDKGVELIVCSPLIRTIDTATIIAKQINYDPAKIVTNPLLSERAYGIYEGQPGQVYVDDVRNGTVHESVETTGQLYQRFAEALEWIRGLEASTILVVSHGGAARAVRVLNENLHHSKMYEIEGLKNAEIYEFTL